MMFYTTNMGNNYYGSYKYLFSNPELVRDLVLGFIPDDWLHSLDYTSLQAVNASYVSDDMKQRHNDMVWKVKAGEEWLYLYLLIEFQSTVDQYMAVRIMTYIGLLYQDLLKTQDIAPDGRLPPILPIVLYNGKAKWTAAQDVHDLIVPVPGLVIQYSPHLRYLLIDENAYSDHELASLKNLVAMVFQLEHAASPESLQQLLQSLQEWLSDRPDLRRTFAHWLRETLQRKDEYRIVLPEIHDLLELKTMLADRVEEWAHLYKAEGFQQGMEVGVEKGIEKGIEKGKEQGEMLALQRLLHKRFGTIPEHINAKMATASRIEIERWLDRVIDAQQLSDIFEQ